MANKLYAQEGLEPNLIHVVEECSEVMKVMCKIVRFVGDILPGRPLPNQEKLREEIKDLRDALDRLEHGLSMKEQNDPINARVPSGLGRFIDELAPVLEKKDMDVAFTNEGIRLNKCSFTAPYAATIPWGEASGMSAEALIDAWETRFDAGT